MRVKFRIDPAMACDGKGDFSTPFREGEYIGFTLNGEVAVKLSDGSIHSYCIKSYEIIIEQAKPPPWRTSKDGIHCDYCGYFTDSHSDTCRALATLSPASESPQT